MDKCSIPLSQPVKVVINKDRDSFYVTFDNYKRIVLPGEKIQWNITIEWSSDTPIPDGDVWIGIYGFVPITKGTPATPFDGFFAYGTKLHKEPGIDNPLTATIESQPIAEVPTADEHVWEYVIYVLGSEGIIGKIDPLVVISG